MHHLLPQLVVCAKHVYNLSRMSCFLTAVCRWEEHRECDGSAVLRSETTLRCICPVLLSLPFGVLSFNFFVGVGFVIALFRSVTSVEKPQPVVGIISWLFFHPCSLFYVLVASCSCFLSELIAMLCVVSCRHQRRTR